MTECSGDIKKKTTPLLLFPCRFSPPYSQNNHDNNYLNLNYEYKGKRRGGEEGKSAAFLQKKKKKVGGVGGVKSDSFKTLCSNAEISTRSLFIAAKPRVIAASQAGGGEKKGTQVVPVASDCRRVLPLESGSPETSRGFFFLNASAATEVRFASIRSPVQIRCYYLARCRFGKLYCICNSAVGTEKTHLRFRASLPL